MLPDGRECPRVRLTCEYRECPSDVDTPNPRFSWRIEEPADLPPQKSLRILVDTDPENLRRGVGTLWDSGTRAGADSVAVRYEGRPLQSVTEYFWTVRLTLEDGREIAAEPARFETGYLSDADRPGVPIAHPAPEPGRSVWIRRTFCLEGRPERARIRLAGVGYHELYVNGRKVGDRVLEPAWTDYDKRVLYTVYDPVEYLQAGENVLTVELADGWLNHRHDSFMKFMGRYPAWTREPFLWYDAEFRTDKENLRIFSDVEHHECAFGNVTFHGVFDGETYDARLEDEPRAWVRPAAVTDLAATFSAASLPPVRVTEILEPADVRRFRKDRVLYDFGKNFAGRVRIRLRGNRGDRVVIRHGETERDGGADTRNLRGAKAEDVYILSGKGEEEYAPRFTYHGFRFAEIECPETVQILSIRGEFFHTDAARTGEFDCDRETLNRIYDLMIRTERSNVHGIPTDCPQRDERMAWVNDMTVRCDQALYNFDYLLFYEKWLRDLADAQTEFGSIPDTAPYVYGGNPAYHVTAAYVLIPYLLYCRYGDKTAAERHYEGLKKYVLFLNSCRGADGLIGEPFYGEWAPPAEHCMDDGAWGATPGRIPPGLISTGYVVYAARVLARLAEVTGHAEDLPELRRIETEAADAVNRAYCREGVYATGEQGCQVFPLFLGIVPPEYERAALDRLLRDLEERAYHITTGNQTTKYLFDVLDRYGLGDTAVKIAEAPGYPGFAYMLEKGATTLWERWELRTGGGMNSHNHPMNGAFTAWFFKGLAGIRPNEDFARGQIEIAPDLKAGLGRLTATYRTVRGPVGVSMRRDGTRFEFEIRVPWNTTARFTLPVYETNGGEIVFGNTGLSANLPAGTHRLVFDGKVLANRP